NYDPGEPCDILCEVTARVQDRIAKANRNGDFEKVTAYSNMGERLQELSQLCGCPAPKDSSTRLDARKLDQACTLQCQNEADRPKVGQIVSVIIGCPVFRLAFAGRFSV